MTNYVAITSILSLLLGAQVSAFSVPMFKEHRAMQRTTPSKTDGVEIELPDFDELFGRIQEVSPLASMAIDGERGGFDVADAQCKSYLKRVRSYPGCNCNLDGNLSRLQLQSHPILPYLLSHLHYLFTSSTGRHFKP